MSKNLNVIKIPGLYFIAILLFTSGILSCNSPDRQKDTKKVAIEKISPEEPVEEMLRKLISNALTSENGDSILRYSLAMDRFYSDEDYQLFWSNGRNWKGIADTLIDYLEHCKKDGLFPEDYRLSVLKEFKVRSKDSTTGSKKIFWANADLEFTNTTLAMINDLHKGRLQPDSLSWRNDTSRHISFFIPMLKYFIGENHFSLMIDSIQPKHSGYLELKKGIQPFLDSMDNKDYTYVKFPFRRGVMEDSLKFISGLQQRLIEEHLLKDQDDLPDSLSLAAAITKYQLKNKLTVDGKYGGEVVRSLNNTDIEKFRRYAVTLDRYKSLPAKLPAKYIWVNIPAFSLKVWENDSLVLESRIICGKPATPTPALSSAITDIVIYPTWTVPTSIIAKEMLPGLKKNAGYLEKKGLKLLNEKGEFVDPSLVSWQKYSKGIPYKIQQQSGDDNALGVIKFNFPNAFDVYLHDTNQRYLFKNSMRALSHGCIRVQRWDSLVNYIVRNDSLLATKPDSLKYNTDSVRNWIAAKERHRILVKNRIPVYLRYFTCEGVDGHIYFYDDIYGLDKSMSELYFKSKTK